MLESLFQNQLGPATARGAIYSPAPAKQKSPLEQFLGNQQFGKQQAGNTTPTYQHLANAGTLTAPTFAPAKGAAPSTDPAAIKNFYSDPANADYHADPALLGIEAADNTTRDNADTSALASRRGLLAQFGDQGLASKVLGADDPTLGAISADPDQSTSILARLARSYRDTTAANEDARNKGNLWYSSARAEGLNNDARDYSTAQADATANAQQQLDAISNSLASVKGGADSSDAAAEQDAFARYLAAVAAHPATATPGGGGTGGTGSGSTDPNAAAFNAGFDSSYNDGAAPAGGYPTLAFTNSPSSEFNAGLGTTLNAPAPAGGFQTMPFTPGAAPASPLDAFLNPKKPVSGYGAGSGSALH